MADAVMSVWFAVASILIVSSSATDSKHNPADEIVTLLNSNRTAHKSTLVVDNPGLGCIALEYIKAYQGQCKDVGPNGKKPADAEFVQTFAPNCGVQVQTLGPITGRLLGCQGTYISPSEAFSTLLVPNAKSLEILYDKNHTQVGAAVSGSDGGGPYFYCVLFSSGKANNTFVFDGGVVKTVRPGCFSGNNDDCSGSMRFRHGSWKAIVAVFVSMALLLNLLCF